VAETGAAGLERAAAWLPHVVMLDVRLPDTSGFDVCVQLRASNAPTPAIGVLLMTAHALSEDRIKAFELGADDYVTKPFVVRELILRATALARRMAAPGARGRASAVQTSRYGAIEFDRRTLEVRVSGTLVELRPSELRLLQVFLEQPGEVLSRKQLMRRVWGKTVPADSRVLDVTLHRLRNALGEQAAAIETIQDGGYRLRQDGGALE